MAENRQWSALSLHDSVRQELLKRIEAGTYAPEDAIPSVAALSEEFGVSPITIKRAVRDLQAMGYLSAIAGKGTFVKSRKSFMLKLDAFGETFINSTVGLLSVSREKISDMAIQALGPPKDAMLCVRKLIFFDEPNPVVYDATYISADVSDEIIEEFSERLVADALRRHNIRTTDAAYIIDAVPASGQAAKVFGVPNGYPMLRRLYRLHTDAPGLTIYGALQAPFDRMACSLNLPEQREDTRPTATDPLGEESSLQTKRRGKK